MESKYLKIVKAKDEDNCYILLNTKDNEQIGFIERMRVGRFMHWCLLPKEDTFFTNGCLKEISKFITKLYERKTIQKSS